MSGFFAASPTFGPADLYTRIWARAGPQFRGAMETLKVLPWRLPQLLQRSFRSRSSSLVYRGRPCCSSLASMWVRFRQAPQVAKTTCQARRSSSLMA
jgi:hypothetical protein